MRAYFVAKWLNGRSMRVYALCRIEYAPEVKKGSDDFERAEL
jgi:hypothetical protein